MSTSRSPKIRSFSESISTGSHRFADKGLTGEAWLKDKAKKAAAKEKARKAALEKKKVKLTPLLKRELGTWITWYVSKENPPKASIGWKRGLLTSSELISYQNARMKAIVKQILKEAPDATHVNELKSAVQNIDANWKYFHPMKDFKSKETIPLDRKPKAVPKIEAAERNPRVPQGNNYHRSIGWY